MLLCPVSPQLASQVSAAAGIRVKRGINLALLCVHAAAAAGDAWPADDARMNGALQFCEQLRSEGTVLTSDESERCVPCFGAFESAGAQIRTQAGRQLWQNAARDRTQTRTQNAGRTHTARKTLMRTQLHRGSQNTCRLHNAARTQPERSQTAARMQHVIQNAGRTQIGR